MNIDDSIVVGGVAAGLGAYTYFVRWLTANLSEAVTNNTKAVQHLTVVIEKCKRRNVE